MGRQLQARILSPFVRQRLAFIVNRERQADRERRRGLVEDGIVKPAVDTAYPLEQALRRCGTWSPGAHKTNSGRRQRTATTIAVSSTMPLAPIRGVRMALITDLSHSVITLRTSRGPARTT